MNSSHKSHKIFIKNRDGLNVRVCIDVPINLINDMKLHTRPTSQKGLVFIMPGLGSYHTKPEFRALAEICTRHGYIAISFDPTHSFGESEGEYADATFTGYASDLEDVIEWASKHLDAWALDEFGKQILNLTEGRIDNENTNTTSKSTSGATRLTIYTEPFILIGHSFGAMSCAYFAERFPQKVKALAPLSTTISGKLSIEARPAEEVEKWKRLGYQETIRTDGSVHKLKWSHMEDRLKYDLLKDASASKITMPVLMIVGTNDPLTPPTHQQLFYDAIVAPANQKELHILDNGAHDIGHSLGRADVLPQVKVIFESWLNKLV
jgi:alpha-beta hydrolase superfamily lysophospholipase